MDTMDYKTLVNKLGPLVEHESASLAELGLDEQTLRDLGFDVTDGVATIPMDIERLDQATIEASLSERARTWVTDMNTLQVVDSTNTLLNELALTRSVNGVVRLAELQIQGRGRRGRGWISPFGNNLAVSLGVRLRQRPDRLGGLSLCVGLAVADYLQALGVDDVELKWPNDVLIAGRKVSGILLELLAADEDTEVVIGVGVNFRLPDVIKEAIDQPVTDLAAAGCRLSRNQVAAGVISSIVDFVEGFADGGFSPMKEAFNTAHRFHGRECLLLMGGDSQQGTVRGVGDSGELLLEQTGTVRVFHSGEVSLRPLS